MLARLAAMFDPLVRLLLLAIALASLLPASGTPLTIVKAISDGGIFMLFFLNGLRLERAEVGRGMRDWRFLGLLALFCFGVMALAGLGVHQLIGPALPPLVALGFIYLGTVTSTVQSATAYSSLAGGSVASSVVAAATLSLAGVVLTAPLFALLAGSGAAALNWSSFGKVAMILLLPFALGQAMQPWLRPFIGDHRRLISWLDRFAISMAVYVAFSGAVVQGLWQRLDGAGWAVLLAGVAAMLAVGFGGAWLVGGLARFDRARRISFLFAGAHKSAAVGAPLALVLFPAGKAGMVMVPLLAYHLLQLMLSAPLASRLAPHGDHHPPRDDGVCSAPTTTATDRSGSPRSTR
nr:bile acid:sodium symporter family protein [Qipengyuania sp. YIM B01966]